MLDILSLSFSISPLFFNKAFASSSFPAVMTIDLMTDCKSKLPDLAINDLSTIKEGRNKYHTTF